MPASLYRSRQNRSRSGASACAASLQTPQTTLQRLAWLPVTAVLVMLAAAALRPAHAAESRLSLDIGSPSATSVLMLPTARTALKRGLADVNESGSELSRPAGVLDAFAETLSTRPAWFDEMVGSHRVKWQYDPDWSSSLGSDYPRFRTPSYLVGNGAPGVAQRVWVQFSVVRRF